LIFPYSLCPCEGAGFAQTRMAIRYESSIVKNPYMCFVTKYLMQVLQQPKKLRIFLESWAVFAKQIARNDDNAPL
jgi:hypothetical protein